MKKIWLVPQELEDSCQEGKFLWTPGMKKGNPHIMEYDLNKVLELATKDFQLCKAGILCWLERREVIPKILQYEDLSESRFAHTWFYGVDFSGSRLIGTNFKGANLAHVDFRGANISCTNMVGTRLNGAKLMGANLYGVDLSRTIIKGAMYDDGTKLPDGFDPEKYGLIKI